MDMRTTLNDPNSAMSDAELEATFLGQQSSQQEAGGGDFSSDMAFQARDESRRTERESLYSRLNPRQLEAVSLPKNESVLILAGAGSGKTSVITARISKLIDDGTTPNEILAVTFTNKASEEMKTRLRKLMDKKTVNDLMVGTFHSLCSRILRDNYEAAGLPKSFAILDTDGQEAICRGALKDLGLTKATVKEAAKLRAQAAAKDLLAPVDALAAAGGIEAADMEDEGEANEFVTPSQCAKYISSQKEAGESPNSTISVTTRSTKVEQMEAVFLMYQERCAKSGLLDFQDLLTKTVSLLELDSNVRKKYRDRFSIILVDEFQDTNDIQYRWLELLKGERTNVMAVGDDYQSIYAFRGANPKNMFRFLREMASDEAAPEGRLVKLEQNYRSLPHILETANAIIANNTGQMDKTLFTTQPDQGERIDLVTYSNGMFEAKSIAQSIHRMVREEKVTPSEIAVLYRTNQQSRLIEQELNKLGVPLTVYGGFRFFERQEVKLVLAYMDLVTDMTRDLSFSKIANFPPRGIGERTVEELRQVAKERGISMMEMIGERGAMMANDPASIGNASAQKKHQKLAEFAGGIMDLAELSLSQPLHTLIESLVERYGIKAHYLSEASGSKESQAEAEERIANIEELISAATQFEIENPNLTDAIEQLPEYMAYVALMTSTSESDMSRKNTVSLMTVHSSKGLEFDNVFIAGLDESVFPHGRAIQEDEENGNNKSFEEAFGNVGDESDDEEAYAEKEEGDGEGMKEERRLMYVAVTRARKCLTITHSRERMINGEIKFYEPSRFLREIPSDRVTHIDDSARHFENNQHPWSDTGNHEYGGDAFDATRDTLSDNRKQKAKPPTEAPKINTVDSGRRIAIIGTAGRDKEKPMTAALWESMVADARQRVNPSDILVSGGAAWADHLAVTLYLDGDVNELILHLPAPVEDGVYLGPARDSAASAANYYHSLFKKITGVDSIREIEVAIQRGAQVTNEPEAPGYAAMFARNKKVAMGSNNLLAYTFGAGDTPADGGTKATWDQSTISAEKKIHVDLASLGQTPVSVMKPEQSIFSNLVKAPSAQNNAAIKPVVQAALTESAAIKPSSDPWASLIRNRSATLVSATQKKSIPDVSSTQDRERMR